MQLAEGVERVVGTREPGEIFGEVPITLGTVFPVGFRAAVPSRVMRIEPRDYHAARPARRTWSRRSGGSPPSDERAARAAGPRGGPAAAARDRRRRIGCDPGCSELRRFLARNQVTFDWLSPDTPAQMERWDGPLPAAGDMPDGPRRRRQDRDPAEATPDRRAAGLGTEPELAEYDVVIVGAGPAGLAAAVYGASEGLRTCVVEREAPGGQAGTSSRIDNYLGFPAGVSGDELASRALQQARRLGAEILVTRSILRIDPDTRQVHLDGGDVLRARTIILACGVTWRQLPHDGFERLAGRGVFYGASRSEAASTHGEDVHIVGAGNSAGQAALFFSTHARSVTILCRGDTLAKSMSQYLVDRVGARENVEVRFGAEVVGVHGEASLGAIDVRDRASGEVERLDSGGLFIFIGADAETGWLPEDIALDERGFVLTGADVAPPGAGRWTATPICSRRACPASSPAATSASRRSSGSPRRSARAAWRSPSSTSTCARATASG